jgi:transposase
MPSPLLAVRALTEEEGRQVERLAHSRTAPARLVERARIVQLGCAGHCVTAVAAQLGVHHQTVRLWVKRFNAEGLSGLQDRPRPGPPPTYTAEEVGEVVAAALTKPEDLGLPFACWTLDRLQAYLAEAKGIAMKRSRLDEGLLREGLRWRRQETWFGTGMIPTERVDPEFATKRGPSSRSTPPRLRPVSWSA